MSQLLEHARRELKILGYGEIAQMDDYDKQVVENVLELMAVFSRQGHSGTTAPPVVQLFAKLAMYEPLAPLTGADEEWTEVSENLWQNVRCSHVFKDKEKAHDIEGIIFRDPDGSLWVNDESKVEITFPYQPLREYRDRAVPDNQETVS
jgi:hypothetical protein